MSDLRFALRQLLKKPGFAVLATLTLTLGIGANLALFAILNELLLRPKPVARPDELWAIQPANPAGEAIAVNACRPYYEAMRQHGRVFNGVIGYGGIMPKLRTREGAERVYAQLVSGDYFSFLGVTPALGRAFLPEEDSTLGTHSVAVISHAFWRSHFGGAPDVLGRTFSLSGTQVEVVGVAPRAFTGLDFAQPVMWLPSSMEFLLNEFTSYHFVGRLAEPALAPSAADLLSPVAGEVTKKLSGFKDPRFSRYGYTPSFRKVRLDPIGRGSLGVSFSRTRIVGFLRFAAIATGLLLLIACANVANLFLARALQRRREMATRLALGATRGRLVRQLLGEGVVIAALGTIGALLAFSWMGGIITGLGTWWGGPALVPRLDIRLVLFAAGVTLVVGIGFALFPALQATGFQLFGALKSAEGGAGSSRKHAWLRHGLIVTQVVGSLVLLCAATLCLRSMRHQLSVDVGFRSDQLAIATLSLERVGHTTNTVLPQLEEIVRRISLLPGVEQAGVSATEPLTGAYSAQGVTRVEGYRAPDGKHATLRFADIGPGALAALGVPVVYGRDITTADVELRRNAIVVNEACVKQFWPDQDPLGKHIDNFEVVGVVKDFRFDRFDAPAEPMMFRTPRRSDLLHAKLLVRARSNPRHVIAALRTELARIHPGLVKQEICTLRDTMRNALTIQNTALRILAMLGGLALALAVIGTYGVMAYMVTNRTREIGVRLAVGATRTHIITLILRAGLRLGVIALAIGLPISFGLARLLRHLLTGVNPFDPLSFGAVAALILAALMVACWLPARRAARVHPMAALRHE